MTGMAGKTIHGINGVREALASGHPVNRVYVAKESIGRGVKEVLAAAKDGGIPYDIVPQARLNAMTETREHQGVAATVSPAGYTALDDCLAACGRRAVLLALDQVQHPKNLGLLIRTAAGAGAAGVVLPVRGGALLDDDVVRASAGTVFRVPVVACKNLAQTLRGIKDAGFWVYGLEAQGEGTVFDMDWPDRCVLVLGNESSGIRHGVRKACDAFVQIPLAHGVESLNVAVAAGVGLFQAAAQHQRAPTA